MIRFEDVKLTKYAKTSGWAAKVGPDILSQVLGSLPKVTDDRLLVGVDSSDDAAVYKLNDQMALVNTLDFFTPIVDDPYTFGQIAAANSLSDIYAMGGEPQIAMNIVCFPNCLDPKVLEEILKGGANKCIEAKCLVVGGHTVQDDEPKFGLSVSSVMHPKDVLVNNNAKPGDVLVLTKPVGVGILNTALKGGMVKDTDDLYKKAVLSMATLNKFGKDAMNGLKINSCTDITGFGLAGHCLEMAEGSGVTIVIDTKTLPYYKEAYKLAKFGLVPKGAYDNRKFVGDDIDIRIKDSALEDIIFDPQTSGGLMISLPEDQVDKLMERLKDNPVDYGIVGRVTEKKEKYIIVE